MQGPEDEEDYDYVPPEREPEPQPGEAGYIIDRDRVNYNNPRGEPTGAFTGRCGKCGSKDLWDDATVYGCNKCGAMFPN